MRPYRKFAYIPPPRTEVRLSPDQLNRYEQMGWFAGFKKNGSNSVVFVPPDRQVFAWNRHGEPHRRWAFNSITGALFRDLPGQKWYVFNGELLHAKTPHIKQTHYLFDVLVYDGMHLTGTTYSHRHDLLLGLWPIQQTLLSHFILDRYTWVARNHRVGFRRLFGGLTAKEDEGLVVKDPDGIYYTSNSNGWMAKIT